MIIKYGPGKRSRKGFVPYGFIKNKGIVDGKVVWWRHLGMLQLGDGHGYISLRAVRRQMTESETLLNCDRIVVPHKKIGYADLVVTLK